MSATPDSDAYSILRQHMVDEQLRPRGVKDQRILDVMRRVPRHFFTPFRYRDQAYEDHPLPIDEGQTISQPLIVALMLEALALQPSDRVLEVGTGSGYVTALLGELTASVVSVERHRTLAESAKVLLSEMRYTNVRVVAGDGTRGFPESAPYDAIIVSAAAAELPRALLAQLAENGRMIIPVGSGESQQLQLIRVKNGQLEISPRELCRFVPLISGVEDSPL